MLICPHCGGKIDVIVKGHESRTRIYKITFDLLARQWKNLDVEDVRQWQKAFPSINVSEIIQGPMIQWLVAHPNRLKKDYGKFIYKWLSQDETNAKTLKITQISRPLPPSVAEVDRQRKEYAKQIRLEYSASATLIQKGAKDVGSSNKN